MEKEDLLNMLKEVAKVYYGEKLKSLHFLLSGILTSKEFINSLQIFEELMTKDYINCTNISLLYDIIHITGHLSLTETVKKWIPDCPNLKTWKLTGVITPYRILLYNTCNKLLQHDISTIKFIYQVKQTITDAWSLLMYLETQQQLQNNVQHLQKLKDSINPAAGKDIDDYCKNLETIDNQNAGPSGADVCGTGPSGDTVESMDVTDSVPNPNLSPMELMKLAGELGHEWTSLGIYLGLTKANIDHITSDNPDNLQTAIFSMLDKWHKSVEGTNKTRRSQLSKALRDTERVDLAEMVEKGTLEQ